MKLAFLGDTSFHNIREKPEFTQVNNALKDIKMVVNLESPITIRRQSLKNKISIRQSQREAKYLLELSPYLVNISNNHINDFGNQGVKDTIEFLQRNNIEVIGAGSWGSEHNVFSDKKEKIVLFSYTTRETDLTATFLFENNQSMGPKELSLELFLKQSKKFRGYKKVILVHWGEEEMRYPTRTQRIRARELIDNGAELIIGTHPHVIQGFERYKGRYVFYSLGNFFFPDIENETAKKKQTKENRTSIIPVFDKNLNVEEILCAYHNKENKIKIKKEDNITRISKNLSHKHYSLVLLKEQIIKDFFKPIKKRFYR